MEDVQRVTREIASGNPEAFARFYKAKFNHVYSVARSTTGYDEHAALDVVQDAMMRVVRYIRPFDDARTFDNWLTRVTRSVAFDHLRRHRRRRLREQKAADDRPTAVHEGDTHELQERLDWVRRELTGLDRVASEIIELRFRAGMSLAAIGKTLGLGTGAVHGRLTRALAKLRQRSRELGDE